MIPVCTIDDTVGRDVTTCSQTLSTAASSRATSAHLCSSPLPARKQPVARMHMPVASRHAHTRRARDRTAPRSQRHTEVAPRSSDTNGQTHE